MNKLLIALLLSSSVFATQKVVDQLSKEFYEDVLELQAFKKRYNKYLLKHCDDDLQCYKVYIDKLKSWKQVQEDTKLQSILHKNKQLSSIDTQYWNSIQNKVKNKIIELDLTHSQFLSVIDLEQQLFILTLWDQKTQNIYFIGQNYISSGNIYRESEITLGDNHYFKTPSGVFQSKIGWRSEGKLKEDQKTLGYGYKDRFVFYFGKQKSIRFQIFDQNGTKLQDVDQWQKIIDELDFALHSHKSTKGFGEPHSHGCVRMSDELNRFLDNNMVLHKSMIENDQWKAHYTKPPKDPKNENLAGEYLIIFDKI